MVNARKVAFARVQKYAAEHPEDGMLTHGLLQHPENFWPKVEQAEMYIFDPDGSSLVSLDEILWDRGAVAASDGSSDNHIIPDVS